MTSSNLPEWAFGRLAPDLEARGFQPIPITTPDPTDPAAGKRPAVPGWQIYRPVADRLSDFAGCSVGILTALTPAIDIDVRDPELAQEIDQLVTKMVGDAPARIGQPPKILRVFRTSEPYAKRATHGFRLPDDRLEDKPHRVEVLGSGQQFVAFGIHPGTMRPYTWPDWSPLNLERDDLPELTEQRAREIIEVVEEVLHQASGLAGERPSVQAKPVGRHVPGPAPRMVKGLDEARAVLKALERIDPNSLDYDGWTRVAYGIKGAFGDQGRDLWMRWSSRSSKDQPDTTEKTWGGVRPDRAGWRYLFKLVEGGHGHS
jgi:hypothetical protein